MAASPATAARRPRRGGSPLVAAALTAIAVLAFVVVLASNLVDSQLLTASYYENVLDDSHAYDRAYNQLGQDPNAATANERVARRRRCSARRDHDGAGGIIGPSALRAAVQVVIERVISFIRSDTPLDLRLDVTDFVSGVGAGGEAISAAQLATLPDEQAASYDDYKAKLQAAVDQLAQGKLPEKLPKFDVPKEQRGEASGIIKKGAGISDSNLLDAPISFAIDQAMDGSNTLAALEAAMARFAVEGAVHPKSSSVTGEFISEEGTGDQTKFYLGPPPDVTKQVSDTLGIVRLAGRTAAWGRPVGAAVMLVCVVALLMLAWPAKRTALRRSALPLLIAGLLGLGAWQIGGRMLKTRLLDASIGSGSGLPATYSQLVRDVLSQALRELGPAFWIPSVAVLALGVLLLLGSFVARGEPRVRVERSGPPVSVPEHASASLRWHE